MDVKPAEFVCWIDPDHEIDELVNDAKALTWENEAEHLLRTTAGRLAMVRGGRDGIRFEVLGEGDGRTLRLTIEGRDFQVARIEWHIHPWVARPSDGDLEALTILKQDESWIYEIGGDGDGTRISPKPNQGGR